MHYAFLILYVIALCVALSLVPPIQRWWRHWRQVRRILVLPIDRVPDEGDIAISGQTQHAGDPVYAPLSTTPCVYWRIVLRGDVGHTSRNLLSDRASHHPFRLGDHEQGIWITPAHATLALRGPGHHAWIGNDPVVLEQLAQQGAIARRWGKSQGVRVAEVCLPVGETVWVYGAVHTTATGKVVAGSATTLLISNRPPHQLRRVYGMRWMGASALLLGAFLMLTLLLRVSW